MNVQLSEKDMAKQFLLDKAKRKAYGKARQNTLNLLVKRHSDEYAEIFIQEKLKQEGIELGKIGSQLESLE